MTVTPITKPLAPNAPPSPGKDAFHRQRSKLIDAFADVEEGVMRLLDQTGSKRGAEPLKQKLAIVLKAKAGPAYSSTRKTQVDEAIKAIDTLLELRADLVHARLAVTMIDVEMHACFVNARETGIIGRKARIMTLVEMRTITTQVEALALRLAAA